MGCEHPKQIVAMDGRVLGLMPVKSAKIGTEKIDWYRHPMLFIPPSIKMWIKEYDYYDGNHSIVPYYERHACWVECLETYEYYMRMFKSG
jgi:hypothetical protein